MATFPSFPSFDFSKLDLSNIKLPRIDADKLRNMQMPTIDLPGVDSEKLFTALRDAAYVTIGFGVLAVQQAQVRRRELVATLSERFGTSKGQIDELLASFEARLGGLDERIDALETTIDSAVEKLEAKLPEQAGALLGQAHDIAKAARKQVRGLVRNAA